MIIGFLWKRGIFMDNLGIIVPIAFAEIGVMTWKQILFLPFFLYLDQNWYFRKGNPPNKRSSFINNYWSISCYTLLSKIFARFRIMHIFSSLRNLDLDEIPNENEAISKKRRPRIKIYLNPINIHKIC